MKTAMSLWWCRSRRVHAFALTGLLVACGGGQSGGVGSKADRQAEGTAAARSSAGDVQALARAATLNSESLEAAESAAINADLGAAAWGQSLAPEENGSPSHIVGKNAFRSGAVANKAAALRVPLFRFFNGSTGAHFFTNSTSERDRVIASMSPPFSFDGQAFSVASGFSPGLSPVHRLYNNQTGVHFYTISESERAYVVATMPQFSYEGVAYHASQVAGQGLVPVYRFFVPNKGVHFYTADAAEKNSIIARLGDRYVYEGVGFYALDSAWRAEKLPHTGVTSAHCFQDGTFEQVAAGIDVQVACSATGSSALNPQQDGHRTAINPMQYSEVPNQAGGHFARTECVRDNVTGLIWEGKAAGGVRGGANTYDNLSRRPGDTSPDTRVLTYVSNVNQERLCGFSDWRLPTRNELVGIGDYGRTFASGVDTGWFPNTSPSSAYWTAEAQAFDAIRDDGAWHVSFGVYGAYASSGAWPSVKAVRLVRGGVPAGFRFSYSSVPYAGDEAENVVNDAWTGLQWRRCEQGRVWRGGACTGTHVQYSHQAALAHARDQSGWRLPNIKELGSLTDLSRTSGALMDPVAFPGAVATALWSSTPFVGMPTAAWYGDVSAGQIDGEHRNQPFAVRLVRLSP